MLSLTVTNSFDVSSPLQRCSHSGECVVLVKHGGFNVRFPNGNELEHLCVFKPFGYPPVNARSSCPFSSRTSVCPSALSSWSGIQWELLSGGRNTIEGKRGADQSPHLCDCTLRARYCFFTLSYLFCTRL